MTIEKIDATQERFTHHLVHEKIPIVDPIGCEIIKSRLNTIPIEMM